MTSWTRRSWTARRCPPLLKAMIAARPLTADQPAEASPAPGRAAPTPAPLPPHPPAARAARLSAPSGGDHDRSANVTRGENRSSTGRGLGMGGGNQPRRTGGGGMAR